MSIEKRALACYCARCESFSSLPGRIDASFPATLNLNKHCLGACLACVVAHVPYPLSDCRIACADCCPRAQLYLLLCAVLWVALHRFQPSINCRYRLLSSAVALSPVLGLARTLIGSRLASLWSILCQFALETLGSFGFFLLPIVRISRSILIVKIYSNREWLDRATK